MGEPIIIWPPDGGNYDDPGDTMTSACQGASGLPVYDCTDQVQGGYGLACCLDGE